MDYKKLNDLLSKGHQVIVNDKRDIGFTSTLTVTGLPTIEMYPCITETGVELSLYLVCYDIVGTKVTVDTKVKRCLYCEL